MIEDKRTLSSPILSEAHRSRLSLHYGINPDAPQVKDLIDTGCIKSLSSSQEVRNALGREDIDGTGLFIRYPGNGFYTVRLDEPLHKDGREIKYLRPSGQRNGLFIPPGVEPSNSPEILITEGEFKALAGALKGLQVVALSGIWCWRTETSDAELLMDGDKLRDDEALLPELKDICWDNKKVILLYDSDIIPSHKGYPAFQRLAEQLYALGSAEVRIVTLPTLSDKKTGLDDFLLARGEDSLGELYRIVDHQEPYLPTVAGSEAYANRLISSGNPDDQLKATIAYMKNKGEYPTSEWLKAFIGTAKSRDILLRDARTKLKEKAKVRPDVNGLLEGSRYETKNGCLCKRVIKKVNGEETEELKPLCNFTAYPLKQVFKDNGIEETKYLEVGGASSTGESFPAVIVPMESFSSMNWVASNWGARASIEPGWNSKDELRFCIQSMVSKDTPIERIYTHLGWRKLENGWTYLHAGSSQVEIHRRLQRYILPEKADGVKEALKTSLSLLDVAPRSVTIPLLASVYLAPMCESLRQAGIEPGFLVWLYGLTGTLKSTLTALFLSHYGKFDNKTLPCSFRDTPASLEDVTFGCKDCLLAIDDFYPSNSFSERTKLEYTAEQLIRSYGDRTGKGRMRSDMTSRASHPPRGMAIATGEDLPSGQSTMARLFVLELHPEDIKKDKLTEAQNQRDLLPQAMVGYLQWLTLQMDTFPQQLLTEFKSLRSKAQGEGRHSRLPEAVAHLYLALSLFLDFAESQGAISETECRELSEEAWKILVEIVNRQSKAVNEQKPTERFLVALREMLAQEKVCLANDKDEIPPELEHIPGIIKVGWKEDGRIFLSMEPAYTAACQYYKAQSAAFPIKKTTLLNQMEDEGLIIRQILGDGEHRIVQKRFGNKKYWAAEIKAQLLEE